ncbi:hypothetical protein G6N05_05260 [Flavobacterium sp. F372]|uniref:ATP-binding protein n=1 Tax=Flavobacterium bernardetii TaxID=2813823 RepID=A0ABR7J1H0_9FLAO|nr:hypothetical protein [Flavobacterium bernardetii]MBC5835788.1 hypothetical protein [Flavobacterium bernardetii]NHF69519.1 hypothetical protein [Flavobacterium bernardetii]
MKTNQFILRGKKGSGKSYLSEKMACLLPSEKVLKLNAGTNTYLKYISRRINESNYDLIIFDECLSVEQILEINQLVILKHMNDNEETLKSVVYLTQENDFKYLRGFEIIECNYQ